MISEAVDEQLKVTDVRPVQPLKAPGPILVTLAGIAIEARDADP